MSLKKIETKWWNPETFARNRKNLQTRALVMQTIRGFFEKDRFTEVDTPALQVSPGAEVHLKAFETAWQSPFEGSQKLYLHTSPEFAMKKLLVAGMDRIFQLCHTYRNEESGATHAPEFMMLEWYRKGTDYTAMMEDTIGVVRACAKACGASVLKRGNRTSDPFGPWQKITVMEAFKIYADVDLEPTLPADPTSEPDPKLLRDAAHRIGISCHEHDRWEDVFFRIMLNRIEDKLGDGVPTILYEYPTCLGALARQKPTDPHVVERFEAYVCGVELCNAFSELTDAVEQKRRFEFDMDMKQKLYGERFPIDQDFLKALAYGLPQSSGNALGVDRLIMLITGAENINDVLYAPVSI